MDELIQQIKSSADIVGYIGQYVSLKKKNGLQEGLCPFHNEKTPSFVVNSKKLVYHCFGCGEHGDIINFAEKYLGLDTMEAIKELANHLHIPIGDDFKDFSQHYKELERIKSVYVDELLGSSADTYVMSRGLRVASVEKWELGYGVAVTSSEVHNSKMHEGRLTFPIKSISGKYIGFGSRTINESMPKYINSAESVIFNKSNTFYGLYEAQEAIRESGEVIVTESNFDVITAHEFGVENVVATLGTSCTPSHINKLTKLADRIVFCFDGDTAGRNASMKALDKCLPYANSKTFKFVTLPEALDLDSYMRANGQKLFLSLIKNAPTLAQFMIAQLLANNDLSTIEGRATFLSSAREMIDKIPASDYKNEVQREIQSIARNHESTQVPQNVEAEKVMLASILRENWIYDYVELSDKHFNVSLHKKIWKAYEQIKKSNDAIDIITVSDKVGHQAYIEELFNSYYGKYKECENILKQQSVKRELMLANNRITNKIKEMSDSVEEIVEYATEQVFMVGTDDVSKLQSTEDVLSEIFHDMDLNKNNTFIGYSTGYPKLDEAIGGLRKGTLTVIAGRPSWGKTALALNIVTNACLDTGAKSLIFSLEMTQKEVMTRIISSYAEVPSKNIELGTCSPVELSKITQVATKIKEAPLFINDKGEASLSYIMAQLRRFKQRFNGIDIVAIDYIELMKIFVPHGGEYRHGIAEITKRLKGIAKEEDIAIILLSQMSRQIEKDIKVDMKTKEKIPRRPNMSDLAESASLEKDADVVMFTYRPNVLLGNPISNIDACELIIAKNRRNTAQSIDMKYVGNIVKFKE